MKRVVRIIRQGFSIGRLATLALLIALIALRILDPAPVETARGQAFDFFQRLKPREYIRQPVAIVDIDEKSIRALGQWPWPRTRMAELVDKLAAIGAVAVAFDIIFSEVDRLSPDVIALDNATLPPNIIEGLRNLPSNDAQFASSVSRSRVVLGQTSVRSAADEAANTGRKIPSVPHAILGIDPSAYLPQFPALIENLPELESAAKGRGVFTISPAADGVYRRTPIVVMVENQLRLALSTELLRIATGGNAFAVRSDELGVKDVKIGGQWIATDAKGHVWPYFTPSIPSRLISFADILDETVNPARLRGHLVLVGTSAIGLADIRPTPLGVSMPGVEIHAQMLENILGKSMLQRPNFALMAEVFAILLLGLGAIILVPLLGAMWATLGGLVVLSSYVGACWFAFSNSRLLIDPIFPTVSVALVFILISVFNYLREEKRREEIRTAFGQYVSPDVVDTLADNPEGLSLGGETRELSILFSDVRGFTAISESYQENPQGLTRLMNTFLNCLSNAVLRHKGTIDKFMGDAIMAFWNAPVTNKNHALEACQAGLEMIRDVSELNTSMKQEFDRRKAEGTLGDDQHHTINIGIGINTGVCVVGNMGSDSRFDYTALGDAVNLASRLEGQSKPYGIKIILGQATAQAVADQLATFEVDRIRVKGKQEPETIFALLGDETLLKTDEFIRLNKLNNDMLQSYRSLDFESASALLELLADATQDSNLELDGYLLMYELRIAEFIENPPGRDWSGIYSATSK